MNQNAPEPLDNVTGESGPGTASGTGHLRDQEDVKSPEVVDGNMLNHIGQVTTTAVPVAVTPTQVRRPWRSTARTVFQAIVALAVLFPVLVETAGLDPASFPWLAGAVAIAGGVARVMALPAVEVFLRRFLPFLAAAPKSP